MATDPSARIVIQTINNSSSVINAIMGDLNALGVVAGVVSGIIGKDWVTSFVAANSELDKMRRAFDAIAGAGTGKLEFDRLTVTANELGLSIDSLRDSYTQLRAASLGTAMEGAGAEKAFRAVAGAMSVLGADSNRTNMAFLAISQMVSKGVVSMEELRRQLSQHLPGAVQIFARSLGVSTQQLYKMVKAGQVGIPEMMKFFEQIGKEYDPSKMKVSTYEQNVARLQNAFKTLNIEIGATGVWQMLTNAMAIAAASTNAFASGVHNDVTTLSAVWDSWGSQFQRIIREADNALGGFLNDFKSNSADISGIAFAIRESIGFIGQSFADLPINIKTSVILLTSAVGVSLTELRAQFSLLWEYVKSSGHGAALSVQIAFQSVVSTISGMLANLSGSMANSLESLGKQGEFIPGFTASVNGIAAGLRSMETSAKASADRLGELKTAQENVTQGYTDKAAKIRAGAEIEKQAWRDTADAALTSRDQQIQAQQDLIANRIESARYDKEEQALWARRVENIKGATIAVADQGKVGKVTANIIKELASIGKESNKGKSGSAGDELQATIDLIKVQGLRNGLSKDASQELQQQYLDALKIADASAKGLADDEKRLNALTLLSAEQGRLKELGLFSDESVKAKVDADMTAVKDKMTVLKTEVEGVPMYQQIDGDTGSAMQKVYDFIAWANSQSATIVVNTIYTSSGDSSGGGGGGDAADQALENYTLAGFASGGFVPGSGTRDNFRALLTPGEFVLNRSAVARLGIPYLQAINTGFRGRAVDRLDIPSVHPRFAAGGLVGESQNHVIELRIGSSKHQIAVTSRDRVKRLADDLTSLNRSL